MKSLELSKRARALLPGGVSHELRYREPHPVFIERAEGSSNAKDFLTGKRLSSLSYSAVCYH